MHARQTLSVSSTTCLAVVALLVFAVSPRAAERPNILLILCDDLGYADVGFNGAKDIQTPALDALARGGIICSSAYAAHPVCGPSRAALLTGRCPHTLGGQFNIPYFNHHLGISVNETFFSEVLQDAGYFTGILGKWHLGEGEPFLPNQRGFDEFYGHLGGGHKYFPAKYWPEYERRKAAGDTRIPPNTTPQLRNGKEARETEYLTDAFSREAVDFVKRASQKDQPFFLYLAYNAPHAPMEAKQEDLEKMAHIKDRKRRTYAAMVHCVDYGVKRVVDALKSTGVYGNTLIIFLSDNGGVPKLGASNAPLKGGKRGVEEGGWRVPMFLHWAGRIPAGSSFEHPVLAMDFYPTLAKLAGASLPKGKILDGKDIWDDLLAGRNPHENELVCAISHGRERTGVGARLGRWKVVRSLWGEGVWQLFDLTDDIGETKDLSAQYPERKEQLVRMAEKWTQTHEMPKWFYHQTDQATWERNTKPYFDGTFSLGPSPVGSAAPAAAATKRVTRKLNRGDSTLEMFAAREKAKYEKNGWSWDWEKARKRFNTIDTNQDGIISGKEKKTYWENVKK